jgi:predicted regulator of Ras-like GTPase activity (Roadblock/LC7/MglB family)
MSENRNPETGKRTITEEMELAGNQVVERVQDMIKEGNVRRVVIKTSDDKVLLDTTLTVGALAGGALALIYWPFAAIAAIAAAVARVKVEIVREIGDDDVLEVEKKSRIEINHEE